MTRTLITVIGFILLIRLMPLIIRGVESMMVLSRGYGLAILGLMLCLFLLRRAKRKTGTYRIL